MSNAFSDFANSKRPLVDRQLRHVFTEQRATARKLNEPYYDVVKQLGVLVERGGKRLRPLLCVLAYQAYGGRRQQSIIQVAASQELLHAFFLIHDDIIDRDYHRWGDHNILGVYFEKYSKKMSPRDALHAAEAQSILAGDACLTIANGALVTSGFEADRLIAAQQLQQQTILSVIGGQVADTTYPYMKTMPTERQILKTYKNKTASYSLSLPLRLGALLAGVDEAEIARLTAFAHDHGIAFQLQDDLLGMFGDERLTGKPAMSDLREGKRTVLVTKALELATPSVRQELHKLLGSDVDKRGFKRAQTIMTDVGARDYVEQVIYKYSERSLKHLATTTMSEVGKQRLTDLVTLFANRDH